MTEKTKKIIRNIITAVGGLGIVSAAATIFVYFDGKNATIEAIERSTVEKLSGIYADITKDMSYDEAFKIVFEDFENAKKEKNDLNDVLKNIKDENSRLNEDLKTANDKMDAAQKYIDNAQTDIDKKIEEQAKEYAASNDYLMALVELKGIVNTTPSIQLLMKEYIQKYESNVTLEVNELITNGKLDEASELVNEGLKYIENNQVLLDLQQKIKDSQPQKMLDVSPKSQSGGDPYEEFTMKTTGGARFYMGGEKYTDGMTFRTYFENTWAVYPLKSNYSFLNFDMGHVDGSSNDNGTTLQIFYYSTEINEYVLHDEIKISSDMPPRNVRLDIRGLDYIKFQFIRTNSDSWYGIGNPILQ